MFRNDDVQRAADRFLRQITKKFSRGVVPDLNHALSICEDDPIRRLLDDESEQVKVIRAEQHRALLRNRSTLNADSLGYPCHWTVTGAILFDLDLSVSPLVR